MWRTRRWAPQRAWASSIRSIERAQAPRRRLFTVPFNGSDFVDLLSLAMPHGLQRAIAPIVVLDGEALRVEGTSFAIADGLFLTAKHVVVDDQEEELRSQSLSLYFVGGRHPSGALMGGLVPIKRVYFQRESDLALLWAQFPMVAGTRVQHDGVEIDFTVPAVGQPCVAVGYTAQTRIDSEGTPGGPKWSILPKLNASRGIVTEVNSDRRGGGILNVPLFQTDARFDAQMSGSPVFSAVGPRGRVIGVVSSSMDFGGHDDGEVSHASLLWPACAIRLEIDEDDGSVANVSLRQLCERGWIKAEGIAKTSLTSTGVDYVE